MSKLCRICFERDESISTLISPCNCKGSSLYVHKHCLDMWQDVAVQTGWRKTVQCSVCKAYFRHPSMSVILMKRLRILAMQYCRLLMGALKVLLSSFIIAPLKVCLHLLLALLTLPCGSLSFG
ncbi:E3 ubiquitin-protein ligase MARCH, partial [archaeon]